MALLGRAAHGTPIQGPLGAFTFTKEKESQVMANQPVDPFANIAGSYTNPKSITQLLRWCAENCHLISPATACARLPDGCSVAVSVVWLDPNVDAHSVGGGRYGLLKHALTQLANAAGISWDPRASGRLDDGSDPHYIHWRSIGAWRQLDGSVISVPGETQMDLREGSAQVDRIFAKATKDGEAQVRDQRAFIMGHAQTKAELRGIRKACNIRAYTHDDFNRPWVVVKLSYTGESADPQIRRENAAAIRGAMLGGAQALFGPQPEPAQPAPMALPAMPQAPSLPMPHLAALAPPPVHTTTADDDDFDSSHMVPSPPPQAQSAPQTAPAAPTTAVPQPASNGGAKREPSGVDMKFGKSKGVAIEDAADKDLAWYTEAIAKSVEDPEKSRFRASNEKTLAACRAELAWRASNGGTGGGGSARGPAPAPPPDFGGDDFAGGSADGSDIPF